MTASSEEKRDEFRREALVHLDALYGFGLRLTGGDASEAEDLVRETVLRAYRARDDDRTGSPGRAWLMAILRNIFVGERRQVTRRPDPGDRDEVEDRSVLGRLGEADPPSDVLDRLADREVAEAIEELEDAFRVPLVLADLEGLSHEEVARTLDVTVGTATSRLFRARRRLRAKLCEQARRNGTARKSADERPDGLPPGGAEEDGPGAPGDMACREVLEKVYEYLDGELDPETQERMHRHVEICQRCYPHFDFERRFLDSIRERGLATGEVEGLRGRLEGLLERVG